MDLATRLAAPPVINNKTALDRWFGTLTPQDQTVVQAAINNADWRHVDLQAALEAEGAPKVADTTFGAWRRKQARA